MSLLKKFPFFLVILAMLVSQSVFLASPAYAAIPTGRVYAKEVEEDKSVTLIGTHLGMNARYQVYLSKYGRYPTGAILVGSAVTNDNGTFTKTFKIPGKLVDILEIGINLTSSQGEAASNWFTNATSTNLTPGEGSPPFGFKVISHKKGEWVEIRTFNLPANATFNVLMGKAGSKGLNGTQVGILRSNKGGTVTGRFDIPEALKHNSQIDIRVENKALGNAFFVRFNNK